jgi:hypothetical protein
MEAALPHHAAPAAQAPAFGRAYLESRTATEDGYIWPYDRGQMISPGPIRERLVEDIGRLVRNGGEDAVVSNADLIRLGWPAASVERFGFEAFTRHKAQQEGAPRPRRLRFAEAGLEAAALTLFCTAALLWAGLGAGQI